MSQGAHRGREHRRHQNAYAHPPIISQPQDHNYWRRRNFVDVTADAAVDEELAA
jgi:hypothetical protein